jgi:hypothetical protein
VATDDVDSMEDVVATGSGKQALVPPALRAIPQPNTVHLRPAAGSDAMDIDTVPITFEIRVSPYKESWLSIPTFACPPHLAAP